MYVAPSSGAEKRVLSSAFMMNVASSPTSIVASATCTPFHSGDGMRRLPSATVEPARTWWTLPWAMKFALLWLLLLLQPSSQRCSLPRVLPARRAAKRHDCTTSPQARRRSCAAETAANASPAALMSGISFNQFFLCCSCCCCSSMALVGDVSVVFTSNAAASPLSVNDAAPAVSPLDVYGTCRDDPGTTSSSPLRLVACSCVMSGSWRSVLISSSVNCLKCAGWML